MRDLRAPVYGWFPEGFDTADLRELFDEDSVDFRSWAGAGDGVPGHRALAAEPALRQLN